MAKEALHKFESRAAHSVQGSVPRTNVLRYNILSQTLQGTIGNQKVGPFEAQSGAGQTGVGPHKAVKFNDWHPGKAIGKNSRGGAIMPGWWIVLPENLARGDTSTYTGKGKAPTGGSLKIVPYQLHAGTGGETRDAFYIHGTGGKGSDGCILIAPNHRATLVRLVCEHGGAWLHAFYSGRELKDALDRSDQFNRTA